MEPRRVTTTWDESLTSENKRHLVRMMWKWPLLGLLVGRSVINRCVGEEQVVFRQLTANLHPLKSVVSGRRTGVSLRKQIEKTEPKIDY